MLKIRYMTTCALVLAAVAAAAGQRGPAARPFDKNAPPDERSRALAAVLRSDAPPAEKAIACKRLAVYGHKDAVPALAPLLADRELASWARIALEAIPDPAADEALRAALGQVQGRLLVGVINSIGVRRDAQAVGGLVERLGDADVEVACAAAAALGRVGGPQAAAALQQALAGPKPGVRSAAAEGCVLAAEKLLAGGQRDAAIALYDRVRKADVAKPRIIEATRGAILARQAAGVPLLIEQLRSADKSLVALGLRVARELPGHEVTDALVTELERAAPERRALLILALADRGDAAATPALVEAAKTGPDTVRIAALGMMGRAADAACLPVLLDAATEDNPQVSQAAAAVLADLPGKVADAAVLERLARAEGKARKAIIELAGQRHVEAATAALLKAADDPDAGIRSAALTALGRTVGMGDLPLLIARTLHPKTPDELKAAEDALSAACIRMPDREACAEKLIAAAAQAPAATKGKLLEILAAMGGAKALVAVAAAAKDPDAEIRDVASRLLGQWMTADAAGVLLDLAKTATDAKYQSRALRGYLRIARQLTPAGAQRLAMCRQAWAVCQRDEERKLVIEVLRLTPSAESLALVTAQLTSAALKQDAAGAAVAIAEKIVGREPKAVAEAMQQVLAAAPQRAVTERAKAVLGKASAAAPSGSGGNRE
jgi:HEAT repeat protein